MLHATYHRIDGCLIYVSFNSQDQCSSINILCVQIRFLGFNGLRNSFSSFRSRFNVCSKASQWHIGRALLSLPASFRYSPKPPEIFSRAKLPVASNPHGPVCPLLIFCPSQDKRKLLCTGSHETLSCGQIFVLGAGHIEDRKPPSADLQRR
jgi:hypothetical protein